MKILIAILLLTMPALAAERAYTMTEIDRMRSSITRVPYAFGASCRGDFGGRFDCRDGVETVLRTFMMNGTDPSEVVGRCLIVLKTPHSTEPCYIDFK